MAKATFGTAVGLLVGGALLAGCDAGADGGRETAALRVRVEFQASEIEALKEAVRDQEARARAFEERLAAVRPDAPPAPASAAAGGTEEAVGGKDDGESPAAPSVPGEAVAAYLSTEEGQRKVREAVQADERRRQEEQDRRRQDQMRTFLKERISGYLTEQLNLDSVQQETVLGIANDAMDRMSGIWSGARDAQGDPTFFTTAREKTLQVRQEALDRLQQALTVDQYNRFQEISGDGGGFLFGGRGPGAFGGGGPGAGGTRGR